MPQKRDQRRLDGLVLVPVEPDEPVVADVVVPISSFSCRNAEDRESPRHRSGTNEAPVGGELVPPGSGEVPHADGRDHMAVGPELLGAESPPSPVTTRTSTYRFAARIRRA